MYQKLRGLLPELHMTEAESYRSKTKEYDAVCACTVMMMMFRLQ